MPHQNKFLKDYRRLFRLLDSGAVFCAFDTETTSLDFRKGSIIEIGAVKFDRTGTLSTFNSLVNISFPIPPGITEITHITDDMLSSSPSIVSVIKQFLEFSKDTILLAHNAPFDLNYVNEELSRLKMQPLQNKAIDTLQLVRWAYPSNEKYNLQYMASGMKIDVFNAHRASDDARVCMEVFLRVLKDTMSIQKK